MGRSSMNGLMIFGSIVLLLGLAGFAIPVFTTHHLEDVARIGDLKVQATKSSSFVIPPLLAGGTLALGVVLIGAGWMQKR